MMRRKGTAGPITNGDFAIKRAVLRVVINVKGDIARGHVLAAARSSNRKIQDPIYPAEVRYEAITGHVAQ